MSTAPPTIPACIAPAPSMVYALHNESSAAEITREWMLQVANDFQLAYDRDFAPAWGMLPVSVVVCDTTSDIPAGARIMRIVDATPEAPGAIAYHTRDAQGRALLVISVSAARSEGGSVLDAITNAGSHELFEAAANPEVNLWVDVPGMTRKQARETCDPVQASSYRVGATSISGFVFRNYFCPEATWPFDQCGVLVAPFTVMKGGYRSFDDDTQEFDAHVSMRKRIEVAATGRVIAARAKV